MAMRGFGVLLALMSFASIAAATPADFSDVDVEGIKKAAAEFYDGPLSYISEVSKACTLTAEEACSEEVTAEVATAQGPIRITVSKLAGIWWIGRWQRELIAFGNCQRQFRKKEAEDAALGQPVTSAKRMADYRSCYPPSGHVGGMRTGSK